MTRGFVLGKFLPPHMGHVYLCDFARAYCDHLTVLVCSLPDNPIPGELRLRWMEELCPGARVLWHAEFVPQAPEEHPDFWPIWREIVRRAHPEPIDFVFASEGYGHRLAKEVGAGRFVPVDPMRLAVPVSGTKVREAPLPHWEHLPPPVRAHYALRVCVFGPESTGKTTLANRLAEHFKTRVVPEYGRTYTEAFGVDCDQSALASIIQGHRAATAAARRHCNKILVLDTDPVLTLVWADMLTGSRAGLEVSKEDLADLYLLTDIDVPWVNDGTRYFPDAEARRTFFERCKAELVARGLPHVTLSGSWAQRETTAIAAVQSLIDS